MPARSWRALRDRLRKQRARLRGTLESYLRGRDTSKYLQQQIVTDRNGRYVLVVRSEHRDGDSGHRARQLRQRRQPVPRAAQHGRDQQRHRRARAAGGGGSPPHPARAGRRASRGAPAICTGPSTRRPSSTCCRRARGSRCSSTASSRRSPSDGRLELRAARHPLLIPAVRRHLGPTRTGTRGSGRGIRRTADRRSRASTPSPEPRAPIPVDVLLIPPVRVLVITGPNTGGKTVALKTAGLLPLMAQAGLLIPAADGTQVPVFRSVFADIGDEQSIAASLSTFSGHIANIVAMDRALTLPALVLLDEAGGGTDPIEGGALAMAMIDHFRLRGAMVVATTHYDALKSYAVDDRRGDAGRVRLRSGDVRADLSPELRRAGQQPGARDRDAARPAGRRSSRARAQHRSEREAQLAEHLAKVERDLQSLDHERRLAARERAGARRGGGEDAGARAGSPQPRGDVPAPARRADRGPAARRATRDRRGRRRAEGAHRRDGRGRRTPRARRDSSSRPARPARRAPRRGPRSRRSPSGCARSDPEPDAGQPRRRRRPSVPARSPADRRPRQGRARSASRASSRRCTTARRRSTCAASACARGSTSCACSCRRASARRNRRKVRVNVELQPREGSLTELNVIGCHVDEALSRAEKFLDEALLAELPSVRLIHGYGTGQLRRAIAEFLQRPHVRRAFCSPPRPSRAAAASPSSSSRSSVRLAMALSRPASSTT